MQLFQMIRLATKTFKPNAKLYAKADKPVHCYRKSFL